MKKCKQTITGRHIWERMKICCMWRSDKTSKRFTYDERKIPVCLACGLVDDTNLDSKD